MIKAEFPSDRRFLEIADTPEYRAFLEQTDNCMEALALWINAHEVHKHYGLNVPTYKQIKDFIKPCTVDAGYYAIVDEGEKTFVYVIEYIDCARAELMELS